MLKRRAENEVTLTNNIDDAIFLMRDGTGISGDFDMGVRGTDHSVVSDLVEPEISIKDPQFWAKVHETTGMIRLVPETKTALIMKGQRITTGQKKALINQNYVFEEYVGRPKVFEKRTTIANAAQIGLTRTHSGR